MTHAKQKQQTFLSSSLPLYLLISLFLFLFVSFDSFLFLFHLLSLVSPLHLFISLFLISSCIVLSCILTVCLQLLYFAIFLFFILLSRVSCLLSSSHIFAAFFWQLNLPSSYLISSSPFLLLLRWSLYFDSFLFSSFFSLFLSLSPVESLFPLFLYSLMSLSIFIFLPAVIFQNLLATLLIFLAKLIKAIRKNVQMRPRSLPRISSHLCPLIYYDEYKDE